jgi:hypothetical protein
MTERHQKGELTMKTLKKKTTRKTGTKKTTRKTGTKKTTRKTGTKKTTRKRRKLLVRRLSLRRNLARLLAEHGREEFKDALQMVDKGNWLDTSGGPALDIYATWVNQLDELLILSYDEDGELHAIRLKGPWKRLIRKAVEEDREIKRENREWEAAQAAKQAA